MDINALGLQQLQRMNPANAPFSTSIQSPSGLNPGTDFGDLLRRSQAARTGGSGGSAEPLPRLPSFVNDRELFEVSLELETILVQNLLRSMRNTVQRTNLIDTGFAGEIYEDMLFDEYARLLTRSAGFGFAEMAYRELSGLPPGGR